MLRHTGPGKVRDILLPAKDAETSFTAVLYNFDIDGDTLKREHKAWLTEHVVPQLSNPQVTINLRGEASRTGSDAYNLALSQRRVDHVVRFLHEHEPVLAQITAKAFGEEDAKFFQEEDNTEDEMFRAVVVKVKHSEHRFVPVEFDRARQLGANDGFDPTREPPWVLVRAEDRFRQMQVENAEGLSLISSNPGVAVPQPALFNQPGPVRINRTPQIFRIMAGVNGDAEIRAVDVQGRIHGRLQVSVLPRLTVKCAFHYVQNPRYGTRTRHLGDEVEFVAALNEIWERQANISFEQAVPARNLVMTDDLGDEIQDGRDFDIVVSHRNRAAQFNVFFVREVEQDAEGTRDDHGVLTDTAEAVTSLGEGNCVFEDDVFSIPLVIAHEAGHCLTLDHNSPIPTTGDMLMNTQGSTGRFLPRVHVLQARRFVRR